MYSDICERGKKMKDYNKILSGKYTGSTIQYHMNSKTTEHDGAYILAGGQVINISSATVKSIVINSRTEDTNTGLGIADMALGLSPTLAAIDASDHKNNITINWKAGGSSTCNVTDSAYRDLCRFSSGASYQMTNAEVQSDKKMNIGCAIFAIIAIIALIAYFSVK